MAREDVQERRELVARYMTNRPPELPGDFRSVVHPARRKTTGYLVRASPAPRQLCDEEVRRIGKNRRLISVNVSRLPTSRPASWVVAMPVADHDEVVWLHPWVRDLIEADRRRVMLFPFPGADDEAVVAAWEATLGERPLMMAVQPEFSAFHAPLGQFLNGWTYNDVTEGRI